MSELPARVLVVDDSPVNRAILDRALRSRGHEAIQAGDGEEALAILRDGARTVDLVLLDLVMPRLDGFGALAAIKADPALRHLPVIIISGVDEQAAVVRCIGMGAIDYLPKPFNAAILEARIASSLAGKRLRDLELEYLEQVGHVIDAATALEDDRFDPQGLDAVAARDDALGLLARSFRTMAAQVKVREERLRAEADALRIEIDEARQARAVAEITDTDYFRSLRAKADLLRRQVRD